MGFNMADEGYLWYGVQRVMLGEVPLHDFMAGDPGRYYWSAALMSAWGNNGIIALRATETIFQGLGLFVGLLLIERSEEKSSPAFWVLSAITLATWMFTSFKVFDISISILLVGAFSFLVQNPTNRRYFVAGLCIGVAAFFGRNHGVYAVLACTGIIVFIKIKQAKGTGLASEVAILIGGIAVGFSPIFAMAITIPGFTKSFLDSIRFLFEIKSTNLSLPIPWPWIWLRTIVERPVPLFVAIEGSLYSLFFVAIPYFGARSVAWVIWQKIQHKAVSPTLVAASFLALPYTHYVYSRADIVHLAMGISPFLIGCLVMVATQPAKIKWPITILLCAASLCVTVSFHPGWQCRYGAGCVSTEISGSQLQIDGITADQIGFIRDLVDKYCPDGQNFLAIPTWSGAYAIFNRKSPMRDIYAVFPRSPRFEESEITRINAVKPSFVFILDAPIAGPDESRFHNTHPIIYGYIRTHFDLVSNPLDTDQQIFVAKKAAN